MLLWNLKNLLTDKGVTKPYRWLIKRGISYPRAWKLLNSKSTELKLEQLNMLCRFLRCTPNDLLAWKEDADPLPPDHPLRTLAKNTGQLPVLHDLSNMNADEIQLLQKFMDELKKRRKG